VSQSQCGWPSSQTSYASSAWWAVTRTNYLIRNRLRPLRLAPLGPAGCPAVTSPGITRPFGRLSRAGGYISDSLLTRPPLDRIAAAPYDLHVLATPPAFRLSQDQTLQLDFVSPDAPRDTPCGVCTPRGVRPVLRRGSSRNEFVLPAPGKTPGTGCFGPAAAKPPGLSRVARHTRRPPKGSPAATNDTRNLLRKAQNFYLLAKRPRSATPRLAADDGSARSSRELIKERSLLLKLPQGRNPKLWRATSRRRPRLAPRPSPLRRPGSRCPTPRRTPAVVRLTPSRPSFSRLFNFQRADRRPVGDAGPTFAGPSRVGFFDRGPDSSLVSASASRAFNHPFLRGRPSQPLAETSVVTGSPRRRHRRCPWRGRGILAAPHPLSTAGENFFAPLRLVALPIPSPGRAIEFAWLRSTRHSIGWFRPPFGSLGSPQQLYAMRR
jgi:hypothetical protein